MRPAPLVVIGLDGAGYALIDRLVAAGHMPALGALVHNGLRADLLSTLPVATLPAWTSFLTATEPAEHGVTDLLMRDAPRYGLLPATGRLRQRATCLHRLSARGLRVASIGMPGTYPPEAVNGICIAGFDAPGARQVGRHGVWPASLYPALQRLGGWRFATFNEHGTAATRLRNAAAALCADVDRKRVVIEHLYDSEPWDLFCVHLQASDTAAHHLWHTFDTHSPRHVPGHTDLLPRVFRHLDRLIAGLVARAGSHTRFLIVSDHGMGGAGDVAVHLNRWLCDQGALAFAPRRGRALRGAAGRGLRWALSRSPTAATGLAHRCLPARLWSTGVAMARSLGVDYERSHAFSDELDYNPCIWLNRAGVFAHGSITDSAAAALAHRLRDGLLGLRHPRTAAPLIERVYLREELPPGPCQHRLPDLLIQPAWLDGYRPSFLPSGGPGAPTRLLEAHEMMGARGAGMPGVHQRAGMFCAHGPEIDAGSMPALPIHAGGGWIDTLLGLDAPAQPSTGVSAVEVDASGNAGDTAQLLGRLSDLGYL